MPRPYSNDQVEMTRARHNVQARRFHGYEYLYIPTEPAFIAMREIQDPREEWTSCKGEWVGPGWYTTEFSIEQLQIEVKVATLVKADSEYVNKLGLGIVSQLKAAIELAKLVLPGQHPEVYLIVQTHEGHDTVVGAALTDTDAQDWIDARPGLVKHEIRTVPLVF